MLLYAKVIINNTYACKDSPFDFSKHSTHFGIFPGFTVKTI